MQHADWERNQNQKMGVTIVARGITRNLQRGVHGRQMADNSDMAHFDSRKEIGEAWIGPEKRKIIWRGRTDLGDGFHVQEEVDRK